MNEAEAQIEKRMPVWEALSELFLDNELQPADHERIAQALAATDFSAEEIEVILIAEVCPVCRWNLVSVAGEWAGFDRDWLREKICPRLGKRPKFWRLFVYRHRWMYGRHWNKIKARMLAIRVE